MKSEIQIAFDKCKNEDRPALLTYTVASDPNKKKSIQILNSIANYADIIELGFPHSTPVGDGGQIQTSSNRSIKNGFKMRDLFNIVRNIKKVHKIKPVILMGYYNMIYQYGESNFVKDCKNSGVSGIICVDLSWPENKEFAKKCKNKSISFIQLLSPTTTKYRMKNIFKDSHDMVYYISMLSTTGGKLKVSPEKLLKNYKRIKGANPKKNLVIGFGITDKTISNLRSSDGLVVGSAICNEITKSIKTRQNVVRNVTNLVKKLKKKIL